MALHAPAVSILRRRAGVTCLALSYPGVSSTSRPIPEKGLSQMSISNRSQLAIDLRSHRRAALHYAPASAAGLVQSWPPRGQEKEGVEPNHVI